MYIPQIQLHEAKSLDEAVSFVERFVNDARVIAGGTDVLVDLKTNRDRVGHLVSIANIEQLQGISRTSHGLRIGAMTTLNELAQSSIVSEKYPAISDASCEMATPQIRNLATVGGNIAGGVPCADLPPVLMVLGASVSLWSSDGERTVQLDEFLVGPRLTSLKANELVESVIVPEPKNNSGAAYERFTLRNANGIAVAAVAAIITLNTDETISDVQIAIGAVAPTAKLVRGVGKLLNGRVLDETAIEEVSSAACEASEPISDIRGSAEYRCELVRVLTKRALIKAMSRAMGED